MKLVKQRITSIKQLKCIKIICIYWNYFIISIAFSWLDVRYDHI